MRIVLALLIITSCIILVGCTSPKNVNHPKIMTENVLKMQITGYEDGGRMPARFATKKGGGKNISIGIKWEPLPAAQSYALLFDDKHPVANNWVHWLVVDIPNTVTEIPEGASSSDMPSGARELVTSWGEAGYGGPQPPVGSGDHEYVAHLYALDVPKLDVDDKISRSEFLKAIEGHVIAEETYSGWFERK